MNSQNNHRRPCVMLISSTAVAITPFEFLQWLCVYVMKMYALTNLNECMGCFSMAALACCRPKDDFSPD